MIRWIASYPKSGNTWVRLFLMAYENPDEFHFNCRPKNYKHDMNKKVYESISQEPIEGLTRDEARLMRGALLVRLLRDCAGKPCYMKTHCANIVVNGVPFIPAEITEKVLYILRDPRDVVLSCADHLQKSFDETITFMNDDQASITKEEVIEQPIRSWSSHVNSWLRPVPFDRLAVRYEDLIDDSQKWFREILRFFEFDFNQEHFDRALKLTAFSRLHREEKAEGYVGKVSNQKSFFRKGVAGTWKNFLNQSQIRCIEADHKEAMLLCAYLPSLIAQDEHKLCA